MTRHLLHSGPGHLSVVSSTCICFFMRRKAGTDFGLVSITEKGCGLVVEANCKSFLNYRKGASVMAPSVVTRSSRVVIRLVFGRLLWCNPIAKLALMLTSDIWRCDTPGCLAQNVYTV
jgi:hypothetical protein